MKTKRWALLLLCILIGMTMISCSSDTKADKADNVIFDQDGISVKIDGMSYRDYSWYIDATVENDTDQAISVYPSYCTLNGYTVSAYGSIRCDANSTTTESFTVDKGSLCYTYELCGLSTIDNVGMSLRIYATDNDDNDFNDEVIAETATLGLTNIEPFTVIETEKEALDMTSVYDDGTYKVSVITVDEDFYGLSDLPMLYLLVENNGSSKISLDFVDPTLTYDEILNHSQNYLEIDGRIVECQDLIYDTAGGSNLAPGSKTILYIKLYLQEAGIQIQDISSIKRDFEIVSMETASYMETLASFTLEYAR